MFNEINLSTINCKLSTQTFYKTLDADLNITQVINLYWANINTKTPLYENKINFIITFFSFFTKLYP